MKSIKADAIAPAAQGHNRAAALARDSAAEVVDLAERRLRFAVETEDVEDVAPIALDLVDAIGVGLYERPRALRIVDEEPRLGLQGPRPHERARIGTHVGRREGVQDLFETPDDPRIGGDEGATIGDEHEPHCVQEMFAVDRAHPRIAGDRAPLPLEGVENALGVAEFEGVGFVEEFRDELGQAVRMELRRGGPRQRVPGSEMGWSRSALGLLQGHDVHPQAAFAVANLRTAIRASAPSAQPASRRAVRRVALALKARTRCGSDGRGAA